MVFKVHISNAFMISTCVVRLKVIIILIDRHAIKVISELLNIVTEVDQDQVVRVVLMFNIKGIDLDLVVQVLKGIVTARKMVVVIEALDI